MPKSNFGEQLRREREMRGVSLEEVSEATRISTRFLQAFEEEQWDRLPGGIFNRGFIRSIARYLGLDEDALMAEYAMATNDRPQVAVWVNGPAVPRHRAWPWLVALAVVLAAGGWFGYRYFGETVRGWVSRPAPTAAVQAEPAPAQVEPAAAESPAPAVEQAAPPAAQPLPPVAVSEAPLVLKIEAGRTTRVTVVADGHVVFDGEMTPGQSETFGAREQFEVSASNSSAVLIELNGQTQPPLGRPGTPGRATLTRRDVRQTDGGRN
jgi:cytoskeleton protein RodZ